MSNGTPLIEADTVILVKKPHTNPRRRRVILRADQTFNGTGLFECSSPDIHFFDRPAGGTRITFNGTDNVFTGDQLFASVELFAEAHAPSASANDIELRLTFTINGNPGLMDVQELTALELTLDIGLSRPNPATPPPTMSQADKVNVGRTVQTATPTHTHERAMVVLSNFQPPDFNGTIAFTVVGNNIELFSQEAPGPGQSPLPLPVEVTLPTPASPLWVQGKANSASAAARNNEVRVGLAGTNIHGDLVKITAARFDFVNADPNPAAAAATDFVRIGLWDHAFDGGTGNFRHNQFIDQDTRRYFLRIRDATRAGAGHVDVQYGTVFANDAHDDFPTGPNTALRLNETPANSGVFVSPALMLVTDDDDRNLNGPPIPAAVKPGLLRRLRRTRVDDTHPLNGEVRGDYQPAQAQVKPFRVQVPIFDRSPDERRRIDVILVDVRRSVGGAGVLNAGHRNQVTEIIQQIYAVCGIFAQVNTITIDPPASCIGWPQGHPDPGNVARDPGIETFVLTGGNLQPSTSQADIVTAVRNRPGFNANGVYVVFVNRLYERITAASPNLQADNSRGQSFPDSWVTAGATTRGFTFVAMLNNPTRYTEVHEITHTTTNLRNSAGGHFDLADQRDQFNLMHRGTNDGPGLLDTKRLWDTAFNNPAINPSALPRQVETIRTSRFTRAY